MTTQCTAVKRGDSLFCSLHDKPLTQVALTENAGPPPDTKAFTCPVSGVTLFINAKLAPDLF